MAEISNDLIYKTLLDQNGELATITEKVSSIEVQTLKTNGRVTALEGKVVLLQDDKKGQLIIATFKKRSIAIVGSVLLAVWAIASIFLSAWVQKLFHLK
jgi:hypothetical protein